MNPIIYGGIIGGITVTVFIVLIMLDVSSAQELQFLIVETEDMDFLTLSFDSDIAICNPSGFGTSFEKINAQLLYKSKELGMYSVDGVHIPPNKAVDTTGRFDLNGENALKMVLGGMFAGFAGQEVNFDPKYMTLQVTVDKNILGIIPISTTKEVIPNQEKGGLMLMNNIENWKCGYSPKLKQYFENNGYDISKPLPYVIDRQKEIIEYSKILEQERQLQNQNFDMSSIKYDESYNISSIENENSALGVYETYETNVFEGESVNIQGILVNRDGVPIKGYTVFLRDDLDNVIQSTKTDSFGSFEFSYKPKVDGVILGMFDKLGDMSIKSVHITAGHNFNQLELPLELITVRK